ncbi:ABC transporter ATP-binding protein [Kribbella solani]|uniref:Peptide/nickel transport system ATP-binding protein n=1 Tax=Kribbella solani TaxID=236067 RepID=A0A841DNH3_9ACTN|nr:ABC transporter ATP-binding protein [Kribbella solani]MBB5977947.1 peptide/nickel transport system ATP-binding protein [Kribbella solani]
MSAAAVSFDGPEERPVLEVERLSVDYLSRSGTVRAVDDVSFTLHRGEILGLAGESGSGKSSLITALLRLQRPPAITSAGRVTLHRDAEQPVDLLTLTERQLRGLRWTRMSIVMQSAMDALNPVKRLGAQFVDVLRTHDRSLSKAAAVALAAEFLELAGIPGERLSAYPHEMSGGMRQRALIALALACRPDVVVMDEPTTAVDVVMQRSILSKVLDLQRQLGFAVIFVTHDLSLLLELADRVAIMYAGRLVEVGPAAELYRDPKHPYTQALRDSFPPLHAPLTELHGLPGSPPDLRQPAKGCRFAPRCPRAYDACRHDDPQPITIGTTEVSCLLHSGAAE